MSKPNTISLNGTQKKRVITLFNKQTRDARKIATFAGVPKRQVMAFLESEGMASYSPGSYA